MNAKEDNTTLCEEVLEYLTERRMCSVENLALRFEASIEDIIPYVQKLVEAGNVRTAERACGSSCSSCASSCNGDDGISGTTILISLCRGVED